MSEKGPIYGVELLDTLPLDGGGMLQQLPSRDDLRGIQNYRQGQRVVAGFEVLTEHYRRTLAEVERLTNIVNGHAPPPDGETDGAGNAEVLRYLVQCGRCWVPGARILGNCRACDVARACQDGADAIEREETLQSEVAALREVVDKPTTADGVAVSIGMSVFFSSGGIVVERSVFMLIRDRDGWWLRTQCHNNKSPSAVYSTREAAEAARESANGNG